MTGPHYLLDGGPQTSPTWHSDGSPGITTGTLHLFAVDGFVTGVRYYAGDTGTEVTVGFWRGATTGPLDTGTLLATATHTADETGWYVARFDDPVAVEPGVPYVASRWHPTSYAFVAGFFGNSHGTLTEADPVYAPADAENISVALDAEYVAGWNTTAENGRFVINAAPSWPDTNNLNPYYGVDVEFWTELPGSSGTLTAILPAVTASISGTATNSGTLTATLPVPTAQIRARIPAPDIAFTLGPPEAKWRVGPPSTRWAAGAPSEKWTTRPADVR